MKRWIFGLVLICWCLNGGAGGSVTDDIKQVKARHEQALMAIPGVVSIGIGLDTNGEQAIVVGLQKLESEHSHQLPDELEGFAVIVRQVGSVEAQ